MTYLLAISIGPVQDFLAAARRTNDLYAGSLLISSITTAAARAVAASGELIYPASPGDISSQPGGDAASPGAGANKILAVVNATEVKDVKEVVERARKAAVGCLHERWQDVRKRLTAAGFELDTNIAEQQINTFIELFAAWCEWDGEDASYKQARTEVDRELAARKALRDFRQPQKQSAPKSSLDPSRDSATTQVRHELHGMKPLYLKPNEHLDAISIIKRVTGGTGAPSTADIAASDFVRNSPELSRMLCDTAGRKGIVVKTLHRAVYPSMRDEMVKEGELTEDEATEIEAEVRKCKGESSPYFAILLADGDGIGEKIGTIPDRAAHTIFSQRLAQFAGEAARAVEDHKGYCVYSGGDDVLAFLPVSTCLVCAAQLARKFKDVADRTLSVGIAIVHYHEPLYSTLKLARDTEKLAKNRAAESTSHGNRLAVTLYSRSGQSRSATLSWAPGYDFSSWSKWVEAFSAGLSHGLPYEWERAAREMQGVELPSEAVIAEAMRIFRRKQNNLRPDEQAGQRLEQWVREQLNRVSPIMSSESVTGAGYVDGFLTFSRELILLNSLAQLNVQWEAV